LSAETAKPSALRFCADPNNLPFSNEKEEGFENKIAGIIAHDLGRAVEFVWWAQRRGYLRNTLKANRCDVVPGIASGVDGVLTTKPYYRSSYVFVRQSGNGTKINSFDDPLLRRLKIGVQIIGDDYANTPPAHALAAREIVNVRGYQVLGDYAKPNPPARIMEAVASGEIDIAVVWGPLAGYFSSRQRVPLVLNAIETKQVPVPMTYGVSMGVRPEDTLLKKQLESALDRRRTEIQNVLRQYGVPR
jgi:mxaJ protein